MVRAWHEGLECEWFRTSHERTYLLPYVDNNFAYAAVRFAQVSVCGPTLNLLAESPMVTYALPNDGVVKTVFGDWPAPVDVVGALARAEVSGESRKRMVYSAYWHALARSSPLCDWVAEHYPSYWSVLVGSFPALKGNE